MWKKLMFGIIIGVMLMTVSTGVIYGAQINADSSAANSSSVLAGNGKGDGNGANQSDTGGCGGTGDCINENGTGSDNGAGNGTGICDGSGVGNGTGNCTNENCTGDCNEGLIKQNGQQKSSNVNGVGAENKKAGSGYAASGQNKNVERYQENFSFMNAFARFLSFFKFGNNV
jgi:hypothetical protein